MDILENLLYQDIHTIVKKTEKNGDNETNNESDNQLILMEFQQSLETVWILLFF